MRRSCADSIALPDNAVRPCSRTRGRSAVGNPRVKLCRAGRTLTSCAQQRRNPEHHCTIFGASPVYDIQQQHLRIRYQRARDRQNLSPTARQQIGILRWRAGPGAEIGVIANREPGTQGRHPPAAP
jgi:hypothetical protein